MFELQEIEFYDVYHLPIIKAYADNIDLVNTINRYNVPQKLDSPLRWKGDPGLC